MAFMNKRQIMQAFNAGQLETVKDQVRTYGKEIIFDKTWDEETGFYRGCNRIMRIWHHGYLWNVHMLNGEVLRLGWTIRHD